MKNDYIIHPTPDYKKLVYVRTDKKHKRAKLVICNQKRFNRHRKGIVLYD